MYMYMYIYSCWVDWLGKRETHIHWLLLSSLLSLFVPCHLFARNLQNAWRSAHMLGRARQNIPEHQPHLLAGLVASRNCTAAAE